jgi:hypothetical protein
MTPAMMRPVTPAMMPAPSLTGASASGSLTTNALLQRDLRLDSRLLRELRRNAYMAAGGYGRSGLGMMPYAYLPSYGGSPGAVGGGYTPAAAPPDPARAALLREQAAAERLANRRRAFDELLYERENTPTPDQELLSRGRNNPPLAEVLSGRALNALLADLRDLGAGVDEGDRPNALLPLDRRGLAHINVTRGTGNIALLKDGGRLTWPAVLAGPAFREPRERLAARVPDVVRQTVRSGGVDPTAIRQMVEDVGQLRALLRRRAEGLSFQPFAEAKAFLQNFDDAIVALQQPDAADHFNGTNDLNARTVLGLVKQMTDNGLRFAPAAPGDEAAYTLLCEALAACDRAAANRQLATR